MSAAIRAPLRQALVSDFVVSVASSFEALHEAGAALHVPLATADLFMTWDWFRNLAASGIDPAWPRRLLLVQRRDGGGAFCLPLVVRERGGAAPLGPLLSSLSNYYSSLFGPIGEPAHVTVQALRAAIRHLKQFHGACDVIELQPLDIDSAFYRTVQAALRAEGFWVDDYFCFGNWHLLVDGRSFAAYEPEIPSRLRNTIKRGRKKLDAVGAWSIQVHADVGPALEQGILDFESIYAKSWKVPEPFPDFIGGLCRSAATHGWLRLGVLRVGDVPVAAQLWLQKDQRALIYKLAYDDEFKKLSAGSVLSAEMMRRAIDLDGASDVDYLTGDDGYKVDWMSHRRERRGIVAFRALSLGGLAGAVKHGLGRARHRLQRRPPTPPPPQPAGEESAMS